MDLSSTESWVSKQNQNNLSTNNIKIHLILPLHSHLQLFHSFETRALDTTPNCKVTDHFHRRIHHLSPLTCRQLESHYRHSIQNCQHRATTNAMGLHDQFLGTHIQWKQEEQQKSLPGFDHQETASHRQTQQCKKLLSYKSNGVSLHQDSGMAQMALLKLGRVGKPLQCLMSSIPAHSDFLFMLKELNETSCWQSANGCERCMTLGTKSGFHSTPVKRKCVQDRHFFQIRIQQLN